jgi:hypothetical protein
VSTHKPSLSFQYVHIHVHAPVIDTYFKFPDQNEAEAAIRCLEGGLRLTLQRFPFLAGTLRLADTETGKLALDYPVEITDEDMRELFRTKQVPFHEHDFPHTYEQLQRAGMPSKTFHAAMFVPDDFCDFAGIPGFGEGQVDFKKSDAPVLRVQACFIPGGLVLSMLVLPSLLSVGLTLTHDPLNYRYIHHTMMDCSGITTFWAAYSANVSMLSGSREPEEEEEDVFGNVRNKASGRRSLTSPAPISVADQQSLLRIELEATAPPRSSQPPVADCYCDGIFRYKQTLPPHTTCTQKLFIMPAARIRGYRDRLRQYFPDDDPPTMCNVLAALVWTHVTRARGKRLLEHGLTETNVGIATDLRKRQRPPITADYMGNLAIFSKATLNISDLLVEERYV